MHGTHVFFWRCLYETQLPGSVKNLKIEHMYLHHLKVSQGMDKRRSACRLEYPKIPFCCINCVSKSGNIIANANTPTILTPTYPLAIGCLQVTCPFKKRNYFYFQLHCLSCLYTILQAFSDIKGTDSKFHPVYRLSDRSTMISLS